MNDSQHYLTKEKQEELIKELEERKSLIRKNILEKIEAAKSLGDLSENAEYQQAREEQAMNEDRINEIENILKSAVVIEQHHANKVELGATVVIRKEGEKEEKVFQIVGTDEVDMNAGKISNTSPIGQALYGKKKGDRVSFQTPTGQQVEYKIIDIK